MENTSNKKLEKLLSQIVEYENFYSSALKRGHSFEALQGVKTLISKLKQEVAELERKNKMK